MKRELSGENIEPKPRPNPASARNAASVDRVRPFFGTDPKRDPLHRISDFGPALERVDLSGLSAIDIGCAEGDIAAWLAGRFRTVEAIELNEPAVRATARRLKAFSNARVVQANISDLPLRGMHDVVFLLGVLHYFPDAEERRRVLEHCLEHAGWACYVRTGVLDFRKDMPGREKWSKRYISLESLGAAAGDAFEFEVLDNTWRGEREGRLGDLVVFRRRGTDNPLPALEALMVRR